MDSSMKRWFARTAVVTGASSGIGAAVALALADAGLKVVGLAKRDHCIEELKKQLTGPGCIIARKCDLTKPEQIADTFRWIQDTHGGTDLLVNNAGVFTHGQITAMGETPLSEEALSDCIDVNFRAVALCTRHAVTSMKKGNYPGHIVNINSIAGHYIPQSALFNVYPATKHAITAFTASLITELTHAKSNIKVTSLSPGLVESALVSGSASEEAQQQLALIPALQPRDIASAVLYVVGTPPHVNITELTVEPLKSPRL